ncbi:MAG: Na+:solute symporter [Flammeovirgaceae bacterium TMED290]|nr:MAG: Na+:solute symporter [Flammeovirgaceae bacterium TMED290]|tara:strand:+ start:2431 stop:4197 length:1767 start_codon:yes stop_codon:yes gene_type:complete
MKIHFLDWSIVILFFIVFIIIGFISSKKSSKNSTEYFLSGRNMPWWLLGISMVATTFSADTPNLVTNIVREKGVSGNWSWWAFLLTGMFTVYLYSKLWRRSKVLTDLEFYEIRYSGKEAIFLRAFRAIYLGVFFNVMIMASVCLAGIKIGGILLGLSPFECIFYSSLVTVLYSTVGGLRGVIYTDLIQFFVAMVGSIWATYYIINLEEIGGLGTMLSHSNVVDKISFFPSADNTEQFLIVLIIPIAVQWWAVWYPGAEPGGGGYIAQRMLSAKNEKNAIYSTLLFNVMHYVIRPWPWILIALSSLILFPNLDSIAIAFPQIDKSIIGNDIAYPAMLSLLPKGLLGIVLASLIAAFMSTISSHLNWGASYISIDIYKRFVRRNASEREIVTIGKISTIFLMISAGFVALQLSDSLGAFNILLQIGAGTGSIFLLRWFWWRVNAFSEITGMLISFFVAIYFEWIHESYFGTPLEEYVELLIGIGITTFSWLLVTFLTKPTKKNKLIKFYNLIKPYGIGWSGFIKKYNLKKNDNNDSLMNDLFLIFLGVIMLYFGLFGIGFILYNQIINGIIMLSISFVSFYITNYITSNY